MMGEIVREEGEGVREEGEGVMGRYIVMEMRDQDGHSLLTSL